MATVVFIAAGLLAVAGAAAFLLGVRGRLTLHDPRCAECGYDLRTYGERPHACPECGSDLARAGTVRFGERRRAPGLLALGALLVVAAVLAPFVTPTLLRGGRGPAGPGASSQAGTAPPAAVKVKDLGDDALLAYVRDPATGRAPRGWIELGNRLDADGLTSEQRRAAAAAIAELLRSQSGEGASDPRGWCAQALRHLIERGQLDDAQLVELAEAWTGAPVIEPVGRVEAGAMVPLRVRGGVQSRISACFTRSIRTGDVRIDGTPVELLTSTSTDGRRRARGRMLPPMEPGVHRIAVDVEWVLAVAALGPSDVSPHDPFEKTDSLPDPAGVPERRLGHGRTTLEREITVVGSGEPIHLPLVDPLHRSAAADAARVRSAIVRAGDQPGREKIEIGVDLRPLPDVPFVMRVVAQVGRHRLTGEPFAVIMDGNAGRFEGVPRLDAIIDALPPDVLSAEVFLEPALDDRSFTGPEFERVWGEIIPLGTVRLQRLPE